MEFDIIEHKTLSEIAAEKVRMAIITGTIASGERITEADVGESLGVSRTAVREAMIRLMGEGFIVKESNKFHRVVSFTVKDVEDVLDIREAMEQSAAKKCFGNPAVIGELTEQAAKIEKLLSAKKLNQAELLYTDIEFHTKLILGADNDRLFDMWSKLRGQLLMLLYQYIQVNKIKNYDHGKIIKAIESNDSGRVVKEIGDHINDTRLMLIEMLEKQTREGGK